MSRDDHYYREYDDYYDFVKLRGLEWEAVRSTSDLRTLEFKGGGTLSFRCRVAVDLYCHASRNEIAELFSKFTPTIDWRATDASSEAAPGPAPARTTGETATAPDASQKDQMLSDKMELLVGCLTELGRPELVCARANVHGELFLDFRRGGEEIPPDEAQPVYRVSFLRNPFGEIGEPWEMRTKPGIFAVSLAGGGGVAIWGDKESSGAVPTAEASAPGAVVTPPSLPHRSKGGAPLTVLLYRAWCLILALALSAAGVYLLLDGLGKIGPTLGPFEAIEAAKSEEARERLVEKNQRESRFLSVMLLMNVPVFLLGVLTPRKRWGFVTAIIVLAWSLSFCLTLVPSILLLVLFLNQPEVRAYFESGSVRPDSAPGKDSDREISGPKGTDNPATSPEALRRYRDETAFCEFIGLRGLEWKSVVFRNGVLFLELAEGVDLLIKTKASTEDLYSRAIGEMEVFVANSPGTRLDWRPPDWIVEEEATATPGVGAAGLPGSPEETIQSPGERMGILAECLRDSGYPSVFVLCARASREGVFQLDVMIDVPYENLENVHRVTLYPDQPDHPDEAGDAMLWELRIAGNRFAAATGKGGRLIVDPVIP